MLYLVESRSQRIVLAAATIFLFGLANNSVDATRLPDLLLGCALEDARIIRQSKDWPLHNAAFFVVSSCSGESLDSRGFLPSFPQLFACAPKIRRATC